MFTESDSIRRIDVRLDNDKLSHFLDHCVKYRYGLAEVFQTTKLYLESNGAIVIEFYPEGGR